MRRTIIKRKTWIVAGLIVLLSLTWPDPAAAERRMALVIGNSAYQNVARLDNPRNDARLVAETLAELGFSLVGGGAQLDLDKASFSMPAVTIRSADAACDRRRADWRRCGHRMAR